MLIKINLDFYALPYFTFSQNNLPTTVYLGSSTKKYNHNIFIIMN